MKDYEPTLVARRELYNGKKQVEVFVADPTQPTIVATGGKDLELSLWDLTTLFSNSEDQSQGFPKPIFTARNVPNDKLDLQVPVWVMAARFLTCPTNNSHRVVIGTKYGQVRVYETNAKRRPVLNHQVFDGPILSLEVSADETQVVVANNTGDLQVLHLEKGDQLGKYKGITGSVKQVLVLNRPQGPEIAHQPSLLVSIAIDRFLRIHHFQVTSRALIRRVYLKQRPSAILVDESSLVREITPAKRAREEHNSIWNSMDAVPLLKRQTQVESE
ncbi:Ribosome biogenesis protein nsa1 (NOP7-associated protein 1) [Massospora cicadina]|nr:Ribosome biogenesis protein nsa1 (NOP7-associated protein 1) [Massospora cicadina]